jgi:predicted transposase YdaD
VQTDAWLYEVFSRFPDLLFRLAGLPYEGHWRFESITVKTTEKRIDGLLLRVDEPDIYIFGEFQGYDDPCLYWRLYREIATWYESHPNDHRPFLALVLYLDPSFDKGDEAFDARPPNQIRKLYLEDCLRALEDTPDPSVVFRPLVVPDLEAARREAPAWRRTIEALNLPEADAIFLKEHLTTLLMGRFRELSREEIEAMLQLTPLRETRAGRDMLEEGRSEGRQEGKRICRIQMLEEMLGLPQSPDETLESLSIRELDVRVAELERQLRDRRP